MRKTLILAALLAATPFAASADELSYTYVEGGLTQVRVDDDFLNDPHANGGYVRGSFAIAEQVNVFGGYSQASKSQRAYGTRVKYEVGQPELGIGYHMNMSDRVDFTADIAVLRLNVEAKIYGTPGYTGETIKDHTTAGRATLGVRGKPSARTEAWLKAGVIDGSDIDSEFVGVLGGQVKFNKTWGLVAEVQMMQDVTQYSTGVRASF